MTFPTDYKSIIERLDAIRPHKYGANRNYIDGAVSYLSPYISRGVISTQQIVQNCIQKGYDLKQIEKFIQELAWRDYWQRVWQEKDIDQNIKNVQSEVENFKIPLAILNNATGIIAIDNALEAFLKNGYLHNHVRMYIASIITNSGKSDWKSPAKWMYYHLLDGDWASNALSWQWVCGANSNKKYYANQQNINKFCHTNQSGTFLDSSYETLMDAEIPDVLKETQDAQLMTTLPKQKKLEVDLDKKTALYTWYNLDPLWRQTEDLNRVLILEPSHFEKYPISDKSLKFLLKLGDNIPGLQVFIGEFSEFMSQFSQTSCYYKEHPTNIHFNGIKDERDWISEVKGYYPSFFGFWKKVKKEIYTY